MSNEEGDNRVEDGVEFDEVQESEIIERTILSVKEGRVRFDKLLKELVKSMKPKKNASKSVEYQRAYYQKNRDKFKQRYTEKKSEIAQKQRENYLLKKAQNATEVESN